MPTPLTLTAPVACPQCGARFTGTWTDAESPARQRCPDGHETEAAWPGWLSAGPVTVPESHLLPPGLPAALTFQQVADQLGMSLTKVKKLVSSGELPAVDVGERNRRIRRVDLASYLDSLAPRPA